MDNVDTFPETFCPRCGEAVGKLDRFCKNCGNEIARLLPPKERESCKEYRPVPFWEGIGPIPCANCGRKEEEHHTPPLIETDSKT